LDIIKPFDKLRDREGTILGTVKSEEVKKKRIKRDG